ncbi:MAG: hypothetical protein H7174_02965 [Flavobacterium sp.]|nr:hypothetical protein [Flavobacterium sp.]
MVLNSLAISLVTNANSVLRLSASDALQFYLELKAETIKHRKSKVQNQL